MITIRVRAMKKPGRKPPMNRPAIEMLVIAPRTTILRQGGIIIPMPVAAATIAEALGGVNPA